MTTLYEATDHAAAEAQSSPVGASQREANSRAESISASPPSPQAVEIHGFSDNQASRDLTALRMLAEMFADYQKTRIATGNRVGNGGVDPEVFGPSLDAIKATEKMIGKTLIAEYKRSVPASIRAWQEGSVGLGAHTFALLIGLLGHPRHAHPKHWEAVPARRCTNAKDISPEPSPESPTNAESSSNVEASDSRILVEDPPFERTLSQLWAYCGVGDPERRPRKGMSQEEAFRMGRRRDIGKVLHVIAEGCVKNVRSPYRSVYDDARVEYATREGWTPLHQHNAALRRVKKEILRDLWAAS